MSTTFDTIVIQQRYSSIYTRHYQPRHPLALQIIEQIHKLELRPQKITQSMGYLPKHTLPACERLRHVLSNRYLGLDGSYIDGRFTPEEFLAKLLSVVEISYKRIEEDLLHIQYQLSIDKRTDPDSLQKERPNTEQKTSYS